MNRDDAMLLASQYAKRKLREGCSPADAARMSAALYGLPSGREKALRVKLEMEGAKA